jgi:TonB family protein
MAAKAARVTPVAIESKPAPAYTEEARRLRVEGDVVLQVVFTAAGQIRIVGVVKSLGHGLDEAAVAATRQIRFTPARCDGQLVDYPATIHVVFALS